MNTTPKIKELINKVIKIKAQINLYVSELPDNKDIQRINKNCFTIRLSQLSKDKKLCPYYYDFKFQYKLIIKKINSLNLESIISTLEKIIAEKSIYDNDYKRIVLHPEVIDNLKKIL